VHIGESVVDPFEPMVHILPQLNEPLVDLAEPLIHIGPQVVETLMEVVDPLRQLFAHINTIGQNTRRVKFEPERRKKKGSEAACERECSHIDRFAETRI